MIIFFAIFLYKYSNVLRFLTFFHINSSFSKKKYEFSHVSQRVLTIEQILATFMLKLLIFYFISLSNQLFICYHLQLYQMKTNFSAIVLLIFIAQACDWNLKGSCDGESPRDLMWRYQLLQDVPNLLKTGYPGEVIVFGQNATVIVVGDDAQDVLIGAAQLGKGRIILMGHTGYIQNFQYGNNTNANIAKLQNNIKRWVSNYLWNSSHSMMKAQDYVNQPGLDPSQYPILYTTQNRAYFTQQQKDMIVDYVRNGGGLVVSPTPWAWAQLKGTNDFTLMVTYKAMALAGLTMCDDVIWGSSTFITDNPNAYLSHIGKQFDLVFGSSSANVDYNLAQYVARQGQYIPVQYKIPLKNKLDIFLTPQQIATFTPSSTNKISSSQLKTKSRFYLTFALKLGINGLVAPGSQQFPGAVDHNNPAYSLTSKSFSFVPRGDYTDFYQTGYYAVAGQTVTIQITGTAPTKNWEVYVGFHTDDINSRSSWQRWPSITKSAVLTSTTNTITSSFGGMIFFKSPSSSVQTLNVTLTNVLEAPYFNSLDNNNVADWSRRVNSLAPWGVVEGRWVGFHMPLNALKTLNSNQLTSVLNLYDQIYESYHSLRGTNPINMRKQYISCDLQISAGYMHSGYPIGTFLDVANPSSSSFLLNETSLRATGLWGIYHELGHNVQQGWWTPSGTGEVTNNIFTLRGINTSTGNSNPLDVQWIKNQLSSGKSYVNDPNQGYSKWTSSPGIALLTYTQIIADYGWSVFENVFASYQTDTTHPNSDQQKIDTFWAKVSIAANANMESHLIKWKIPYTSAFTNQVSSLPAYVERVNMFNGI